jgi:hypothetical protein
VCLSIGRSVQRAAACAQAPQLISSQVAAAEQCRQAGPQVAGCYMLSCMLAGQDKAGALQPTYAANNSDKLPYA